MSIITGEQASTGEGASLEQPVSAGPPQAAFGATLALTATLAAGCFLLALAVLLSVVHAPPGHLSAIFIRQAQSGKTALYVGAFVVLLPLAVLTVPRLADRIAAGPNAPGLEPLAATLAATLAAAIILVRVFPLSHHGLRSVLIAVGVWALAAAAALTRAMRPDRWSVLLALVPIRRTLTATAVLAWFGVLLCITALDSLSGLALGLGVLAAGAVVLLWGRVSAPSAGPVGGGVLDLVVALLLLVAVTNVVVYHASSALPQGYFPPGLTGFQQDWILGPANQLLHGGALLVNDPSSQYGVGLVYFVAAWFHLAPIGYGTFGLLDGILTSLVYIGGYFTLRAAGVSRLLAVGAMALGVAVFIYHLQYPVGSLPEQGPLRFGLPMVVIVAVLAGAARPRLAGAARVAALIAVGIASIWAVEAFAYTAFTYLVLIGVQAYLHPKSRAGRWVLVQIGLMAAVCVCAHLILALATLAATGYLPDWSQYLAYVHGLLLGGREGAVTYGFANWSPGLGLGAACLFSALALVLLLARAPARARARPRMVLALAGTTAYAIASFSYSDNRSSTYLLPYVALPALLAAVLWLAWVLESRDLPRNLRRGVLAGALGISVLLVAAAWPTIGTDFSQSALARAYPSGGLSSALNRLWHQPPIDPRAPAVQRLLARYIPQKRVVVLFPVVPDLAIEALMRSHRATSLYLGDPAEDIWVRSVWIPRVTREIDSLKPGSRVLLDGAAIRVAARLRALPAGYALAHPVLKGNPEIEWIIHRLDRRFRLVPIHRGPYGLEVVRLVPRSG